MMAARSMLMIALVCLLLRASGALGADIAWIDATEASGLPLMNSARLCLTDLNDDGRPDVVAEEQLDRGGARYRVLLNRPDDTAKIGFRFVEVEAHHLPVPSTGDCIAFADLDNDGFADAVFTRYLDLKNPKFVAPTTQPTATCWLKGNGDGTFSAPQLIESATRGTTACLAVGDANCDGLPDLLLGNWYDRYGPANTAYPTDLLVQMPGTNGAVSFRRVALPEDAVAFDEERDDGPRPTYGVMFVRLSDSPCPSLLQLNYGRRANRLYVPTTPGTLAFQDKAVQMHLDGDAIRHGKYPQWLKDVARTDKRFDRDDEKPYRSHGNTFDAAVGDVNNDGRFDLFFAEIAHAWAGESSDRSRFLIQRAGGGPTIDFEYHPELSVDRAGTHDVEGAKPQAATHPTHPNWNQGDLFAALADLDHDGKLDLILCSSDYPDPPPHENRLRIWQQTIDGTFRDVTLGSGIDHLGAQQPSLADVDGDGDLDLLVGQSFNRFPREMIERHTPPHPVARLYLNQTIERRREQRLASNSIELRLVGDPKRHVTRSAFNAIVRLTTVVNGTSLMQSRQLIGPGGHDGKEGELIVHFGLGGASEADEIRVEWPAPDVRPSVLRNMKPGSYTIRCDGSH
jgi:hypothetical protein